MTLRRWIAVYVTIDCCGSFEPQQSQQQLESKQHHLPRALNFWENLFNNHKEWKWFVVKYCIMINYHGHSLWYIILSRNEAICWLFSNLWSSFFLECCSVIQSDNNFIALVELQNKWKILPRFDSTINLSTLSHFLQGTSPYHLSTFCSVFWINVRFILLVMLGVIGFIRFLGSTHHTCNLLKVVAHAQV